MKAMLLAAGRGERMRELTADCPKPLLRVAGKPLLAHHLERLQQAGVRDVVVNAAYLGDQIEAFIAEVDVPGLRIQCSRENERLETGGGILNALPLLGSEPFLVVNSDIWCDIDYAEMMTAATESGGLAHLVLVPNPAHNEAGDFGLSEGWVINQATRRYTYAGVSVLTPALFADQQPGHFGLAPLLRSAAEQGRVSGQIYNGFWLDIGTPERYQVIQDHMKGVATGA